MTNTLKGTLMGILFTTLAIVLWIVIFMVGFIAGIAGALIGILFIKGYEVYNHNDKSNYKYVVSSILIGIEIIFATLCCYSIYQVQYDFQLEDVMTEILLDIGLGFLFSYLGFFAYVYSLKNKEKNGINAYKINIKPIESNEEEEAKEYKI